MYPNSNRIRDLEDLETAAKQKRAIVVPGTVWEKPRPAAVILFLQGASILSLIRKGMYLYKKPKKEE